MRFQEIFESADEDRAIISLSSAIYEKLQEFQPKVTPYNAPKKTYNFGKIGDLFSTSIPVMDDIYVKIQADKEIWKHGGGPVLRPTRDPDKKYIGGLWDPDEYSVVFNENWLKSNYMKTVITHELRHALDDVKTDFRAGESKRYFSGVNRHKYIVKPPLNEPPITHDEYLVQPGEVNARFSEVLHGMTMAIRRAYGLPPENIKPYIMQSLRDNMATKQVADLFPHGKDSSQYKRLMKRALEFIKKEMAHHEQLLAKQGRPKHALGTFA